MNIQKSGVWNVGTGKAVAFLDIAKEIAKETDSKIEIIPVPEILKPSYQYYTCANLTKLNKTLSGI